MRRIYPFKKHPSIKGAIIPTDVIHVKDEVILYGRGSPRGTIIKVDKSLYHRGKGSIWYDILKRTGRVVTRRSWDFKEVWRPYD